MFKQIIMLFVTALFFTGCGQEDHPIDVMDALLQHEEWEALLIESDKCINDEELLVKLVAYHSSLKANYELWMDTKDVKYKTDHLEKSKDFKGFMETFSIDNVDYSERTKGNIEAAILLIRIEMSLIDHNPYE